MKKPFSRGMGLQTHLFILFALSFSFFMLFNGCKSKDELMALSKCEFRVRDVSDVTLAGLPVEGVDNIDDLSTEELGVLLEELAAAFA